MNLENISNSPFLTVLEEEFRKKKVIVFCGAGISYDSGVPLVNEVKTEVLKYLCKSDEEINELANIKLPFELFMQTLLEHSGSQIIFDLFELGKPNKNHFFLAMLAKQSLLNVIVTTNFDSLIESALEKENVEYDLFYKGTDFLEIDWTNNKLKLIKLHGSIHDKKNIAITIKRVAEKQLYTYRKTIISNILNGNIADSLFLVGYSCSDYFDVNPIIEEFSDPQIKILYLQHSSKNIYETSIAEMEGNNPFKKYSGLKLNAHTDTVIDSLTENLLKNVFHEQQTQVINWRKVIEDWVMDVELKNGRGIKDYLAGQLFNVSTKYGVAIKYFEDCTKIATEHNNHELLTNSLFATGRCYRDTQRNKKGLQKAFRHLYHALKLSSKKENIRKQMHCMLSLGVTWEDKKDHYRAIYLYENAWKIAVQLEDKDTEAICLGNLAIVFKNMAAEDKKNERTLLGKALRFQHRALELSIQTGDKGSEGRTYGNMGVISSCMGEPEKAISYYEKAYKIAIELNDIKHQGIWTYNKGYDMILLDPVTALKEIKSAKHIFANIDPPLEAYISICQKDINELEEILQNNV